MPLVTMPDGAVVDMPDQLTPDLASRLQKMNAAAAPQPDRGIAGQVKDFASASGHHLMNLPHGIAQFIENGAAAAAGMVPENPVSRFIIDTAAQDNAAMQQREKAYQAATPDSAGAYAGATIGEIAPFLVSGPAKGLAAAGDAVGNIVSKVAPNSVARIAPKVASGATQAAILGAAQPVSGDGNYWDQKANQVATSAAIGGAVPAVANVATNVAGAVKRAAAPFTNPESIVAPKIAEWKGGKAPVTPTVPGSLPTTAQAVGTPELVQAEKALMRNNPDYASQFVERANENASARLGFLSQFGGDDAALQAAKLARDSAVAPKIESLLTNGKAVPVNGILNQLSGLKASPLAMRPGISGAADDLMSAIRAQATENNGVLTVPPANLDVLRQNLRDFLEKYSTNGIVGSQQSKALEPVRTAIIDAIEGANPGYRSYLADYAKLSQPINTMETVNSILDAAGNRSLNSSGGAELTLGAVNTALRKIDKQAYPIADQAKAALEAVRDDLQRASISNSRTVPGSDTAYNLQAPGWLARQLYGDAFQGGKAIPYAAGGLTGLLSFTHGAGLGTSAAAAAGAKVAADKLSEAARNRVNDVLARALLDPQYAAYLANQSSARIPLASQNALLQRFPQANLLIGNTLSRQVANPAAQSVPTP